MHAEIEREQWADDAALPASVIVERTADPEAQWRVLGVVVGQRFASGEVRRQLMRSGPEGDMYMWMGYALRLRKAHVEDYALNINSAAPVVFVVARQADDELQPLQATVSLSEAQYLDATDLRSVDETVYRVPMPPEVYRWLEGFVLEHYVPRKRKRRGKRRSRALFDAEVGDWAGEET